MTDRYAADFRIEGEGLTAGDVDEVKIQLWEVADAFNGSVIVQRKPWPGSLAAAAPSVPADADLRDRIEVWPLKRVLAEVRCGSSDWTWAEEWADLDRRHAETGYLAKLEQEIHENGITTPLLIGSDGRLWDGHHRLRIAVRRGIGYVPVEISPSRQAEEALGALVDVAKAQMVDGGQPTADLPAPGEIYRHYKGGLYTILSAAEDTGTGAPVVVYRDDRQRVWARPLVDFTGTVGGGVRRFVRESVLDERVAAAKEQQAGEGR